MCVVFWKQFPKGVRLPVAAFIRCEQVKKYILLHCSLNYPFLKNQCDEASVNIFVFQQLGFGDVTMFLNSAMGLFSECHLWCRNACNTDAF